MSTKTRTSCKRQTEIPDTPNEARETGEQGQCSQGRIEKISLKKSIGTKIPKRRIKVNSRPEPSSSSSKEPIKDTGKQKEGEQPHLKEDPLPSIDETYFCS